MTGGVYLIRDTEDPVRDLERGFSGNVGAWFADFEAAAAYAERHGSLSEPRQCPRTKMWCGDPELGLSSFAVTADSVPEALERIAVYVEWRESPTLAVFAADDVDYGIGLDGEDVFRGGSYLGRVPYPFEWSDIEALCRAPGYGRTSP